MRYVTRYTHYRLTQKPDCVLTFCPARALNSHKRCRSPCKVDAAQSRERVPTFDGVEPDWKMIDQVNMNYHVKKGYWDERQLFSGGLIRGIGVEPGRAARRFTAHCCRAPVVPADLMMGGGGVCFREISDRKEVVWCGECKCDAQPCR